MSCSWCPAAPSQAPPARLRGAAASPLLSRQSRVPQQQLGDVRTGHLQNRQMQESRPPQPRTKQQPEQWSLTTEEVTALSQYLPSWALRAQKSLFVSVGGRQGCRDEAHTWGGKGQEQLVSAPPITVSNLLLTSIFPSQLPKPFTSSQLPLHCSG